MANVMTQQEFVPTNPDGIAAALGDAVTSREERSLYRVSSSINMILLASCRDALADLHELIDTLSVLHPGRYFAVYLDELLEELKVEVSARCYGLSKQESLCSEVIMVGASRSLFQAVPSVLFAHVLSGSPIELFLCDPCSDPGTLMLFLPLAKRVIFSSSHYFDRPEILHALLGREGGLVDLEWLDLTVWRRQTARAFDRPELAALLPQLTEITVSGRLDWSFEPWLLAGWLADRLGVRSVAPAGKNGVLLEAGSSQIALRLAEQGGGGEKGLFEVKLALGAGPQATEVCFRRGQELETMVTGERSGYYASEPFGEESWAGRLKLYFDVGESTVNFPGALENALAIRAAAALG